MPCPMRRKRVDAQVLLPALEWLSCLQKNTAVLSGGFTVSDEPIVYPHGGVLMTMKPCY